MTSPITIVFATPSCAYVTGDETRELLVELGGRPVWAPRQRAWVTTPQRARDLIAVAESRGRPVRVTSETETEVIDRIGGGDHG